LHKLHKINEELVEIVRIFIYEVTEGISVKSGIAVIPEIARRM
jgi:hypothetical protein